MKRRRSRLDRDRGGGIQQISYLADARKNFRELSASPHSLTCATHGCCARSHRHSRAGEAARARAGRIRAHKKNSRARAEFHRTGNLLRHVERALLLQKFAARTEKISDDRAEHSRES